MNNAIDRIRQADPAFWRQDGERLARVLLKNGALDTRDEQKQLK